MKILIILLITFSCTQKYQRYPSIKKKDFSYGEEHNPETPLMRRGKMDTQTFCEGQILFNKNAHAITQASINSLVAFSCPHKNYLLDVKLTETWWTLLVYSRSCIKLESYCPITK